MRPVTPAHFLVTVHDVAPPFLAALSVITAALRPLVGQAIAGAVIPNWHQQAPITTHATFASHIRAAYGEVLLHGYTHAASHPGGPIGWLTRQANELSALAPAAVATRLRRGQADLHASLGVMARGFVPPAWQPGPITPALLESCQLSYMLDLWRLHSVQGAARPLAVFSWDCGRVPALGLVGEALGALRLAAWSGIIPCIVIHPHDVTRGYLSRALQWIRRLLTAGLRPALPGELVMTEWRGGARV